ncbi:MAG: tail fiber domain-containing protein, partial [Verrucomicrobiales bacterium]
GHMSSAIDSIYSSVPQSEIQQLLQSQAIEGLQAGTALTDDEARLVQQASRTAYNDRGLARSNAAIGDEILQTYGLGNQMQQQRQQFALQVDQYNDNKAASRSNAIVDTLLNPTPATASYAAGLTGQAPAASDYANSLFSQNYEGAFAGYNNEANMLAALYGGQMQLDAANDAASASKSAGMMSALGAMGGAALLAFSDARLKEGVERIGTTKDGLPWYSYHYKGDPTRREGVMAQEIVDLAPDAVVDVGGVLAVNYEKVI